MNLVVRNKPLASSDEARSFHMVGPTNQGADNEDLGPLPDPEREPGTRPDGDAAPPEELDPKDPRPPPEPDDGVAPPPNEAPIRAWPRLDLSPFSCARGAMPRTSLR